MNPVFTAGLLAPLATPVLLLALLAAGLWAAEADGPDRQRIPFAALIGLAGGIVAASFQVDVPRFWWLPGATVILLGLLGALIFRLPYFLSPLLVAAIFLVQGYLTVGGGEQSLLAWVGFACGAVLAVSAGFGLTTIIAERRAIWARALGGAIMIGGALILLEII